MAAQKDNNYFHMFLEMASVADEAASKLIAIFEDFNQETLPTQMKELHAIESTGDRRKHELMEKLAKEFITPIDREDIFTLASELDDVVDAVEDVVLKMRMYNIQSIRHIGLEFACVIQSCCAALHIMMREFHNFRKSKTMLNTIIEINRLEEDGDQLYMKGMRELYTERSDPFETAGWTEIYNTLENCCDTCEHVADVVERVIMKNT